MNDLKEQLKKIYIFGRSAERDWKRLLGVTSLLLVALGVWSFLFFVEIKSKVESSNVFLAQTPSIKGKTKGDELEELVKKYEERAKKFNEILGMAVPASSTSSTSSVDRVR